jgi:hypothetical protein
MPQDARRSRSLIGPFEFRKAAILVEATPMRAGSISQLLTGVTLASELSIFYHLHQHFLVDPNILPEYPNDFARWVAQHLGNGVMAERLANLNLFRAANLAEVRHEITVTLAQYLAHTSDRRQVQTGHEFIFCQPRILVMPCHETAATPEAFLAALRTVEIQSIAYHLLESKVEPTGARNDFTRWFEALGFTDLADRLDTFDPYLNSLEDNRSYLVKLIADGLRRRNHA